MCHRVGLHGKASVAPILEGQNYGSPLFVKAVRKTIAYGSPSNRSMPDF